MLSKISALILKLLGWKLIGDWPDVKKFVLIAIPHTSNWEFPYGILIRKALRRNIQYIAKDSLFQWPIGGFFRWTGGVPVDRSKNNNFVDAVVDVYNQRDEFAICIAPEGTRSNVGKLKTGFYYIAKGAGCPIVMISFDYGKRQFKVSDPYYPTDDKEADFAHIREYFKGVVGKIPAYSWGYKATSSN